MKNGRGQPAVKGKSKVYHWYSTTTRERRRMFISLS